MPKNIEEEKNTWKAIWQAVCVSHSKQINQVFRCQLCHLVTAWGFQWLQRATQECESALHRELRYTAVSPRKISCLSQLAVRQKMVPSERSHQCWVTFIQNCHPCLTNVPGLQRSQLFFFSSFLLWLSRLTCISHFLAYVLSGFLHKYLAKIKYGVNLMSDWDSSICWRVE